MYKSIAEIKAAHKGHWFDRDAMRFFRSRMLGSRTWPTVGGAYFITSEQREYYTERMYTVRWADCTGTIHTVGEFMRYRSWSGAAYAIMALLRNRGPWTHCDACTELCTKCRGDAEHRPYVPDVVELP